jgi:hypothetical protein
MIEITRLTKTGGPLTKRISLSPEGKLISDGSACVMSRGHAQRVRLHPLRQFPDLLQQLEPNEAIALGTLQHGLPDHVEVTTQARLAKLNGAAPPGLIARTGDHIGYEASRPTLALIDVDTKGMPENVKARIKDAGSYWSALVSVVPALATAGRIVRQSTSSGISRTDTGESLPGSNGQHIFLLVQDGADVERFLRTLHERCWLVGLGWHMVGAGGQLLDRSLVDRMVFAPERLVFESAPVLAEPLIQDQASRQPRVYDGAELDTKEACPPLRIIEAAQLKDLKSRSAYTFASERAQEKERFIAQRAERLAETAGLTDQEARRVIEKQCDGILLPDLALPWDSDEYAGCTVADVLADPARFLGATLADPLEGPDYGRTKAKVMRRADGSPWINSFAHGRTVYELRYDARAAIAAVTAVPEDQAADTFVRVAVHADLDADQMEALRNQVAALAGVGKRAIDAKLKTARNEHAACARREAHDRHAAARRDPRPQIPAPLPDAPWIPEMEVLNDVLGASRESEPPMRDIDGFVTQVVVRRLPNMHALTSDGANGEQAPETRQEATEQPLLARADKLQLGEMIERYIDYVDESGRSVHLAPAFVDHYLRRQDRALPTVAAISTLPLVLADGTLLDRRGLDRERGIVFRVPGYIAAALPEPDGCTDAAVAAAMGYLVDGWLCDVAADYIGKAIIITAALTIIERSMLAERPAFFIMAGRRGGGKTTVLQMLCTAVTGNRPSAAAWSPNEEERRKALLSYLMTGLPAIIWDNIPRGTQISCPHIEAALTSAFFSDRKLGVSETVVVSAATVQMFTGNNIRPRGDLASRSLQVRLEVDRHDPENRTFRNPDPLGWTETHRPQILRALYTILLGNPVQRSGANVVPETRFKGWWRIVGSAVEHAAMVHAADVSERVAAMVVDAPDKPPVHIRFRDLFLSQEEDDEESSSLTDALTSLAGKWPNSGKFQASEVATLLNYHGEQQSNEDRERVATLREFLFPKMPPNQDLSAKSVGRAIKRHVGEPVKAGDRTLILKEWRDPHGGPKGALSYYVQSVSCSFTATNRSEVGGRPATVEE